MNHNRVWTILLLSLATVGCGHRQAPPPRGEIPPPGAYSGTVQPQVHKPLPDQDHLEGASALPPPFDDSPLLTQPLPEQAAFVQAYRAVGAPRIALFVNRTAEGHPIVQGGDDRHALERIDYDAVENVLTDWLAAGGAVVMVSPRLGEAQARQLKEPAKPDVLHSLSREGGIDVLVHVQARLTSHFGAQPGVRLLAEAVNTAGGESLARAFIDMPPVMDKPLIADRTRFLARKLMLDMTRAWENAPASGPPASQHQPGMGGSPPAPPATLPR